MLLTYLGRMLTYVLRPRFTWRDIIAVIVGTSMPVITGLFGYYVIEGLDLVGWEIFGAFGLLLLTRTVEAPYLMWRELLVYVSELQSELDDKITGE